MRKKKKSSVSANLAAMLALRRSSD